MKNIIILGGSFDPIHLGHIEILNEALKQKIMMKDGFYLQNMQDGKNIVYLLINV